MKKNDLIDEMLRQGIKANSRVQITIGNNAVIGNLTDAKIYAPNENSKFDKIGFIPEPAKGMINTSSPLPIRVKEIDSIEKLDSL